MGYNAGSFGTVYRADWHGSVSTSNLHSNPFYMYFCGELSFGDHKLKIVDWGLQDVAVKVLTDQDVGEAQLKEFLREVTLPP